MAIIMNAIPTTATLGGRLALNQVVTAPAAAASTPAPAAATPSQQSAVSALTSAAATAAIVQTPVLKLPVVQPADGAFPELIAATNGGVLYDPNRADALANALAALLHDPRRRDELGRAGRQAVREKFTADHMARAFAAVCAEAIQQPSAP